MRISVIVCTHNRAYTIAGCLDSIAASLRVAAPVEAEIIVVDNASTDDTSAVVKAWAATSAFPVNLLLETEKGISAARNCAIRAAKGVLLAFTDDDCRLSLSHVSDALRHDDEDKELVLRGGYVALGDAADLPLTILTDTHRKQWAQRLDSARDENVGHTIFGCNMTMRRALAERIGFFDTRLGGGTLIPAGEDVDYVFRAYLAGLLIEYVPDMAVSHFHGRKLPAQGKKLMQNYAAGEGALYAKYFFKAPYLCRQLYWDLKDLFRGIRAGKNNYMPELDFSYQEKLAFCLRGAFCYWRLQIGGK